VPPQSLTLDAARRQLGKQLVDDRTERQYELVADRLVDQYQGEIIA
jgi:hypothetical protein